MLKWLCLLALYLAHGLALAQSAAGPAATAPPVAFVLTVEANDEIKQLLERHLDLQRYRTTADLSDEEIDRLIALAQADAQKLVATLGYFAPVIQMQRATLAGQRQVHIRVVVGEAVRIHQVMLRFAGAIADDPSAAGQRQLIQDSWQLPAGNRFTQPRWDDAKQQALRQLSTLRYPTGRISASLADVDPLTRQVRLDVTLDSGPLYRLGELSISGLERHDAELVRKLARLSVGAEYEHKELVQAQERLTKSGFFNTAFISVDTRSPPQAATVLISLREAKLQKVVVGLGASTDSGGRVSVEHVHNQFPTNSWRTQSKASADRETQYIGTGLISPPNERGWRMNAEMVIMQQASGSFDVLSQLWRVGSGKEEERIDRHYYLQYERSDTAASDLADADRAQSISAVYNFTVRYFDSMPFPTGGWAFGADLGGGVTLGGERVPYGRVLTRWQFFWPLGHEKERDSRDGRISLRAQAGAVLAKADASLPATQLFLAGGDNSVRGYRLRSIGTQLEDGQISAGRYMLTGSLEWQRPITRNSVLTEWEGVVFIDAGAVANRPSELRAQVGLGAGVRWRSPVGPLQMDLAYGVEVRKFRMHMNVGFTF